MAATSARSDERHETEPRFAKLDARTIEQVASITEERRYKAGQQQTLLQPGAGDERSLWAQALHDAELLMIRRSEFGRFAAPRRA